MQITKRTAFCFFILLFIVIGKVENVYAQLNIIQSVTATNLVNNLVATGFTVSNANYAGDVLSCGSFTNGSTTNLGINNGIILATGRVKGLLGVTGIPQSAGNQMSDALGTAGDITLDNYFTGSTQTEDASVLTFDFVPVNDTIKFRYVFGSEEYPEYVCSNFNDIFGFFITGPNPLGGNYANFNVATIPGTTIPVRINSINPGTPGSSAGGGNCGSTNESLAYSTLYVNNGSGTSIVFDGFTKVLTAYCKVIPCSTYTMKFAIADVGDGAFDSGVFIEANSFTNGLMPSLSPDTTICSGDSYNINMTNAPAGNTFTWSSNPPGFTGSTANVMVSPTVTTTYSVHMQGALVCSGQDLSTKVTVYPIGDSHCSTGCNVSNTALPATICSGANVTLNAVGSVVFIPPVVSTITWSSIPSGYTNTGAGPFIVNPTTTTTYIATVSDGNGTSCSSSAVVIVNPNPTSTFTVQSPVCENANSSIAYTGTILPAATYTWNFDGGTIVSGSAQGPYQIKWATAGTKNVTLSVTANGCTSTLTTISVTVNPMPVSTFTASPTTICTYDSSIVTYTGTQIIGAQYTWNFAGGSAVPGTGAGPHEVVWATTGTNNITLTVSATGCTSTQSTVTVTVNPEPTSTFTAQSPVCENANSLISYTGSQIAGASYNWNFDGGTIVSGSLQGPYQIKWATAGIKNITLSVTANGCTSVLTAFSVTVNPMPTSAFFASPTTICTYDSSVVTYTGTQIPGANYNWNFDSGSAAPGIGAGPHIVEWLNQGIKNITLIVSANGCTSTQSNATVTVNPIPTSLFVANPSTVCENQQLTISYTGAQLAGANYNWNFNGGSVVSGSGAGPYSISWATAGTKIVTLTVIASGCSSSQTSVNITVNPMPTSAFIISPSTICTYDTALVTYTGIPIGGATYAWNFNGANASPGVGQGPHEVNWSTGGTRNITLTVSAAGCISTQTAQTVIVNTVPGSNFNAGPNSVCIGQSTELSFLSNPIAGATYVWDFAGGSATPGVGPGPQTVTWANSGVMNVGLVVMSNGCISNPTIVPVSVKVIPTSNFTVVSPVCANINSDIVYIGTAPSNSTFQWNFSGGFFVPFDTASNHVRWTTAGTYYVTLTVIQNGCSSPVTTHPVRVSAIPSSTFTVQSPICFNDKDTVRFTGSSPGTHPGSTASYFWSFGSPGSGISANPGSGVGPHILTFDSPGVFTITLVVTDSACASQVTNKNIVVSPIPTSDFTATSKVCAFENADIAYTGQAGTLAIFHWDFDGGDVAAGQGRGPYKVNWDTDSVHNVSLVVIDNNCYSDTSFVPVFVNPLPDVQFAADQITGCGISTVKFQNLTVPVGQSWTWNFGDSLSSQNTSQLSNPKHIYYQEGVYTVTLSVTSLENCYSMYSIFNMIQIYPKPEEEFVVHPEIGSLENPEIDFFSSSTYNNVVKWTWNFDDPSSGLFNTSSEENPKHIFSTVDTFKVYLIVESEHQCKDTARREVIIKDIYTLYISNAFTPNGDMLNDEFGPKGQYYDPNSYLFIIYDRWGEEVFKTNDFENKWDGKVNGGRKVAQAGVYNWMIVVKENNGIKHKYLGQVTLIP